MIKIFLTIFVQTDYVCFFLAKKYMCNFKLSLLCTIRILLAIYCVVYSMQGGGGGEGEGEGGEGEGEGGGGEEGELVLVSNFIMHSWRYFVYF